MTIMEDPIAPPLTRFSPADEAALTDRLCEVVADRLAAGIPTSADELTRVGVAAVGCSCTKAEVAWIAEQADVVLGLAGLGCL